MSRLHSFLRCFTNASDKTFRMADQFLLHASQDGALSGNLRHQVEVGNHIMIAQLVHVGVEFTSGVTSMSPASVGARLSSITADRPVSGLLLREIGS